MQKPSRIRATSLMGAMGVVAAVVVAGARPAQSQVACPAGMAYVNGFCVDRFEASLVEILPNGEERPFSPYLNPGAAPVRAVSARGVVPQGYISQVQATRACARAGKRLCSEREWFRACRGPRARDFGYGMTRDQGRCNENHRWHPVVRLFSATARYLWGMNQMNDPQINQLPGTLALTGAHSGCTNEHGVFDMVGNLHEWIADANGTFKGGFYVDAEINGRGCLYTTTAHALGYHDYSTGFRCCLTP